MGNLAPEQMSAKEPAYEQEQYVENTKTNDIANLTDLYALLKGVCRKSLLAVGVFSGIANLLMLVPAFYMLNVYDKALGTNSEPTLLVLSGIAAVLYFCLATMEAARSVVLVAIGKKLDRALGSLIYTATYQNSLKVGPSYGGIHLLNDFSNLRQFIAGTGALTVFDLPWLPVYLSVMFLFHPVLGWLGVIAALVTLGIAIANQRATTKPLQRVNMTAQASANETARHLKNAEVAESMGMFDAMLQRWRSQQDKVVTEQQAVSNINGVFSAAIKTLRIAIQSIAIGVGALLAIKQEISPGMLIAGSILIGRALQPIDLAVGSWREFVTARARYGRLKQAVEQTHWGQDRMSLPTLRGAVIGENVTINPPASEVSAIQGATFEISPGTVCLIVGPSGAGKSTLVRGILGLWPSSEGEIRIDGSKPSHYSRSELGPQIGYLPQDIEIYDGGIGWNIARLGAVDSADVILAARDAGIHEFILSLPDGYDTELGQKSGIMLSPGQRQRLALARALYRRPKLVVLDEPNSNLDQQGEQALNRGIGILKEAGSTVIIVSHRQGALSLADQLIVVSGGTIADSGPTQEVLSRLDQRPAPSKLTEPALQPHHRPAVHTIPG